VANNVPVIHLGKGGLATAWRALDRELDRFITAGLGRCMNPET
jgi:hypothetical protein